MPTAPRLRRLLLPALLLAVIAAAAPPAAPPGWTAAPPVIYPRLALRGYGPLAGEEQRYTLPDGTAATLLLLDAADAAAARRTATKFARDVEAPLVPHLPALAPQAGPLPASWLIPGQGLLAVRQQEARVALLAAPTAAALEALLTQLAWPPFARDDSLVPPWLDAWDRHGFRFYYRPWETPRETAWADYPVNEEFAFAERSGGHGFVFWANPEVTDAGPALTNQPWWDWAARAAARRQLPYVINTMAQSPTWLLNRYREQTMAGMPQYLGSYHGVGTPDHAGGRQLSWCATTAKDAELALTQQVVRAYAADPLVLEWLEPHGELAHGEYDVLLEYGPVADASYRAFLRQRYGDLATLATRWHGDPAALAAWEAVRVPEVASFLGWGPDALDLTGTWRLAYEHTPLGAAAVTAPPPEPDLGELAAPAWYAPGYDDSAWPTLTAPGDDVALFLPRLPALLRRTADVPAAWLGQGQRTWLYVWDLNSGKHQETVARAWCNGQPVGDSPYRHPSPHWAAYEVTAALRPGANTFALHLAQGFLGYRVYLAHQPPREYPALGPQRNAQWVDFTDWRQWTRLEMCRRGMAMIRQADPDRSIVCMAPDSYFTGIRQLATDYGAHFHNTGHMGGFWNDYLPMLMRGADLPFSLEPGGPADSLPALQAMLGRYLTEGVQAVHYFIHVGNLLWPPELRAHFETVQPLLRTLGKAHPPKAQVAMLLSDRTDQLTGYPWGQDFQTNLPTGYWGWRFSDRLGQEFAVDAITDRDFAPGGLADAYRVVLDTNTAVMDRATVAALTGWVERGGLFVALIQTGRHTPEEPDSWPIASLTGYRVTAIDPHTPSGNEARVRGFRFSPEQTIFSPADFPPGHHYFANGLSLERVAPEAQNLAYWADGPVAIGLRRVGRGTVIQVGVKFGAARGGGEHYTRLLRRIVQYARIPPLPAQAADVYFRHSVSNTGLYDLWTLFNLRHDQPVTTTLRFAAAPPPCHDLLTGQPCDPAAPLTLAPLETRILASPRQRLAEAPGAWFTLQRGWWRGTTPPAGLPLAVPPTPDDLDLTQEWACQPLPPGTDDQTALADPALDDTAWPRRPLTCWTVGAELPTSRAFFRRRFTVPAHWQTGELTLWLRSYFSHTVVGQARYWLDGQPLAGDPRYGLVAPLTLAAGSTHLLAVEVRGAGQVVGVRGHTWLTFTPAPLAQLDLAGEWTPSTDFLASGAPLPVPGPLPGQRLVHRTFDLPPAWTDSAVYLHVQGGHALTGVLVNGRYLRRHHHALGELTRLNVTPLLRPGANDLAILLGGGKETRLDAVVLRREPPEPPTGTAP